jgi:hypothetical protein
LPATIAPLKKVTLSLLAGSAGSQSEKFNLTAVPVNFQFIYGVASDGLCPFEAALHDKAIGDSLILVVPSGEAHEFFGHLFSPLYRALGVQIIPETITLQADIMSVAAAENQEIVQSLAKALAAGGCGGSCGCGC